MKYLIALMLGSVAVFADTFYVSTTGDNGNAGTEAEPWRNIWYAGRTGSAATAGDTVIIKAGEYNEWVTNLVSGSEGSPITFTGERGEDGEWLTIIDPSTPLSTGWVEAPEVGDGVWKQAGLPFTVREMTIDDKRVGFAFSAGSLGTALTTGWKTNWATGLIVLAQPSDVIVESNISGYPMEFWDGIEALFCSNGTTCYLRLRDGSDPNGQDIRVAPNREESVDTDIIWPAISIGNRSYITWRNVCVRGAVGCFFIAGANAHHITIESNRLSCGITRLTIGTQASCNTIRNNTITTDYYGYDSPGSWGTAATVTKENLYLLSKYLMGNHSTLDNGIFLDSAGASNVICWNTLSNNFGGNNLSVYHYTTATVPTDQTLVYSNLIAGTSSVGMMLQEGQMNTRVFGNLFVDNHIQMRLHHIDDPDETNRLVYVYRNLFWKPADLGSHLLAYFYGSETPPDYHPTFWFYHNSFAGGHVVFDVAGGDIVDNGGMTNLCFVNNIMSDVLYAGGGNASPEYWNGEDMVGLFAYNLYYPAPTYPSSDDPAWFGSNNIETGAPVWATTPMPTFILPSSSGAINAALDVSQSFTIGETTYDALPVDDTVKVGSAWDMGAMEFTPPSTAGTLRVNRIIGR